MSRAFLKRNFTLNAETDLSAPVTIQIINIKAGYGEVWQEMNWVCSLNTILSTTTTTALTNNPRHQPPTQRSIITKNIS